MNLPGEETYWQNGVSACAVCDGAVPIFRQKPLAVIGGGDSAAEEATCELPSFFLPSALLRPLLNGFPVLLLSQDLTKYASHVYVLVRKDELRASKVMANRLLAHPKVTVMWNVSRRLPSSVLFLPLFYSAPKWTDLAFRLEPSSRLQTEATECLGDGDLLTGLSIFNNKTQEKTTLPVNGLFYAIGALPLSLPSFLVLVASLTLIPCPFFCPFLPLARSPPDRLSHLFRTPSQATSLPPPSLPPRSPSTLMATSSLSPEPLRPTSRVCSPPETSRTSGTSRPLPAREPDAWPPLRRRGCWPRRREITISGELGRTK
jgi:hypothetical protein